MHRSYMTRALGLAEKGLGNTAPNPAVGCVIVKDGQIVGEGFHKAAGEPHAEVVALDDAGDTAEGSDLYVTLEPCCHHGRTPPCTEAIHHAGVQRVFYACQDPDPRVGGGGHRRLVELGHSVFRGPMERSAQDLNRAYFKHKRTGLPYVTLKMAMTLDGKVATRDGSSQWITGPEARRQVHRMRGRNQLVMVGSGTACADDPRLTCRIEGDGACDALIVDTSASTRPGARVFQRRDQSVCMIAVSEECDGDRCRRLTECGAQLLPVPAGPDGLDLRSLLTQLGDRDVMSILCEGGPTLAGTLLQAGLVDEIAFFIAPKILGQGIGPVADFGAQSLTEAYGVEVVETRQFGRDLMIRGTICSQD
jgi:diaminohydroxyphosphoribosylaminopyrimidine deaminase/5-amino-6-(5-phosphoribosylamino)uracil reductase